jgi:CRISPR type I-D-associated protein Csc2
MKLLEEPTILSKGVYLQIPIKLTLLDEAIIRSNEPEEVLTFGYEKLGNRFIMPWRKIKGKLRRLVLEKQRGLGIEPDCALKDDLCMKCPTCFLFGGTGETSSANVPYNILSRVYGETFISESEIGEITPYTANAISEKDLTTGQALMSLLTVPKETVFYGVITLKDPTLEMVSILIDNIDRLTRIGARSVEWGRIQTEIEGYHLSDREELSAYLRLSNQPQPQLSNSISATKLTSVDMAYKKLDRQVKELINSLAPAKKENSK